MKILVISLLRLGDIVLASGVPDGLKKKYPGCEVHMLINSQFAGVADLIPSVDKFIYFDRERIQNALGEVDRSLFESYDLLRSLVSGLRGEDYNQVLNLTHNKISGWISSLVRAGECTGLSYSSTGNAQFGSPWFRYLNSQMSSAKSDPFHYVDIFSFAAGLDRGSQTIKLQESKSGKEESEKIIQNIGEFIVVQPLTSDTKKNWPLSHFASALKTINTLHPTLQIVVMGAPSEANQLEPFVETLRGHGLPVVATYCGLSTAYSLLKKANLVLTGDTSILHLASAAGSKIVEISIGSSHFQKTGPYVKGSLVIQSKEPCAPCPHRAPCSREVHACGQNLTPELVSMVVSKCISDQVYDLRLAAREFEDEAEIFQTDITETGYWSYHSLTPNNGEGALVRLLDLSSWKLFFRREFDKHMGEFGTEGVNLRRTFKNAFPETAFEDWNDLLTSLENRLERFEAKLNVFTLDFKEFLKKYDQAEIFAEFCERLENYAAKSESEPVLGSYLVDLQNVLSEVKSDGVQDFVKIRRINDGLIQSRQRLDVELRLLRSLKTAALEKI